MYYNNFYYDPAGNRTRLEYNDGTGTTTTSYLYNSADQLTRESVGETNTTYLYDANGNLTKKDDGTNVHSYAYDFRNLMTSYDGPGSSNDTTYKYDAEDRRITKDVNGTKTAYSHDRLDVVAEYNGSDQLQRTYVTPGLDQNLSMTASGSTYYYAADGLGSIRNLLDSSQVAQNTYDYQAFGSIYGTPTENLAQPARFTGRTWDAESALHYYRARTYASSIGRFDSRDPLWPVSDSNIFRYAKNNPVSIVDPLGLGEYYSCLRHQVKRGEPKIVSREEVTCPHGVRTTVVWLQVEVTHRLAEYFAWRSGTPLTRRIRQAGDCLAGGGLAVGVGALACAQPGAAVGAFGVGTVGTGVDLGGRALGRLHDCFLCPKPENWSDRYIRTTVTWTACEHMRVTIGPKCPRCQLEEELHRILEDLRPFSHMYM